MKQNLTNAVNDILKILSKFDNGDKVFILWCIDTLMKSKFEKTAKYLVDW